jgi:transposase-like protein
MVIRTDETEIRSRLDRITIDTAESASNDILDTEMDAMCYPHRYERSPDRINTGVSSHNGRLKVKITKPCKQTFKTAVIKRYRFHIQLDAVCTISSKSIHISQYCQDHCK